VSFYFTFEEGVGGYQSENKQGQRNSDGHFIYEPTPPELATFEKAATAYATGLFDYLHENDPGSFHSVTVSIDDTVVQPNDAYPLRVDVVFDVLYNEIPEDAPSAEEVTAILKEAFESDEFNYFYLWGRHDIWNNVSGVVVVSNIESRPPDVSLPTNTVYGKMLYDFSVDPSVEPTQEDYATLTTLTENFFTDILSDLYQNDPDSDFQDISATRDATSFDSNATIPVTVDFIFEVQFSEDSLITPSSEDITKIMAAGDPESGFGSYISLYLSPSNSTWSTVSRVTFVDDTPILDIPELSELPGRASAFVIPGTMIHSFYDGKAVEPTEADIARLEMATSAFFLDTLTNLYTNNPDRSLDESSTSIDESYYTHNAPQPLRVDYSTSVSFLGLPPDSDVVFQALRDANYTTYIAEYLWTRGAPWNEINGVMYMERLAPL